MTLLHEVNQQMSHSIIGSHLPYYVDRFSQSLNSSFFHIQHIMYFKNFHWILIDA